MKVFFVALVAMVFACATFYAQSQTLVQGVVTDAEGNPLARATVRWKNTMFGVFTDSRGSFTIERTSSTDTLLVSYVGFTPEQLVVKSNVIVVHLEVENADAVEVIADESTISSTVVRTEMVTRKELTRAACCSLAESFERSPSVEVSYSDAVTGARAIRVLGLSGNYTQMLTEAVPLMRSLELPYGMEHIPGPFMSSISIAKGATSVSSGYEAMTGAINVWMHDPFDAEPLYVNVYGNTMDRFEVNAYGGQWLSPTLATTTMVHGRIRSREVDNNNDGFIDAPTMQQLNAVHKWMFNDDEIEFQFFVHGVLDRYQSGQTEQAAVGQQQRYEIRTDIERLESFMKLGLLDVFYDLDESSAAIILSGVMHNMVSTFGNRLVDAKQRTFDAKALIVATLSDDLSVNTGLTYRLDNVTENAFGYSLARTEHVPGAYVEATITPTEDVTMIVGTRVDAHNLYGTRVIPRFNVRWQPSLATSVRASAGRGWRVPSVVTENLSSYINSRTVRFDNMFLPEDSYNVGASFTSSVDIVDHVFVFDAEIFHTEFSNQIVVDFDRDVNDVWVTNLNGESFSTSIMAQLQTTVFSAFDVGVAYRWLNVQAPLNGTTQQVPMISRDRVLVNLSWESAEYGWQADATVTYMGPGRLPSTANNPVEYQRAEQFPGYWRVNAQLTKKFGDLDVYLGSENINGFIQTDPIIAADDPFGEYFDASLAWGPTMPRIVYLGARFVIDR